MPLVTANTIGQPSRLLLHARDQHLVADATTNRGGAGEAWVAGELLLAAVAACATVIVESSAIEQGVPVRRVDVTAESESEPDKAGHYAFIRLHFTVEGASQADAERLVGIFTDVCPIYGTLSRGAPVSVSVTAVGAPA